MGEIAHAVEDAAKKAEQGLAQDFSKAYHDILKDTEKKSTQIAEGAARDEEHTAADLEKAAEHPGTTPHDPHTPPSGGPSSRPGEGGEPPSTGRDQVQDPNEAGRSDGVCSGGEPVDMATGRMYIDQVDASLPSSLPLLFTRSFESGYGAGHWMGKRWVCTFDERLEIDAEGVVHLRADRVAQAYPHPEPGEPVRPSAGARRMLEVDARARSYTVTEPGTGIVREFTVQHGGSSRPEAGGVTTALLTRVRDRAGRHYDLEYDSAGTPLAIQHSGGYRLLVTTQSQRITSLALAGAALDGGDQELMRYAYDEDGNLTEAYNSSGLPMRFAYDAWGRITSWTDRNNSHYWYVYDAHGRVVDEGGEDGTLRFTFHYEDPDPETGLRVNSETNALGHTTRYQINAQHQVVAVIDPLGNSTHYERDQFDRLLSETDPLGRTTRYEYDGAGDLTAVVRPDGERNTAEYAGELSLPTRIVEPGGAEWLLAYNEAGLRTSVTDPLGATTRFEYDRYGHLSQITDALGNLTVVRCDKAGLPIEITDPTGAVTRTERDAFGRAARYVDALGGETRLTWTVEGQPTSRITPDGASASWSYDGEGNVLTHTDELGQVTTFEYTHFERLSARTNPDGSRYTFTHDDHLRLTAVTNPLGQTWSYSYDAANRLVSETDFDQRTVGYRLDAAGQLVSRSNPLGQLTHYTYDLLGRTTRTETEEGVTSFGYAVAGHLIRAVNSHADLVRTVDAMGNLLTETVNGRVLSHIRDALGRRVHRTTPSGHTSAWTYDASGRPTVLNTPGGTLDFSYDQAGRERLRTISGDVTLASTWDARHRLIAQTVRGRRQSTLQHREYAYRSDSYLTGVDDQFAGNRTFDLDHAGRVTGVRATTWNETYAYDTVGSITSAEWPAGRSTEAALGTRTYSGTAILTAGRVRYEYDAAGRTTLRQVTRLSRKPDTWRYTWDAEDRLSEVTTPDGTLWRYLYDAFGRRIAKQRLSSDGAGGISVAEQTDFTWDGATLAEQTTHAGYLPGPHTLSWDHNGLHPLAQTETISTSAPADPAQQQIDRRFFAIVTDLVGSPTELVDPATEGIAWRAASTLWGNTTWPKESTTYTPLRFPGQYFDPETRLHYNLHRYYDPETARFTTPDPLGLRPAPNPAAYVHNPHTWSDPLGLSPLCHKHGGDTGSPDGPGIVPGPAPQRAADMLAQVNARAGGIGKIPGYHGNANWGNTLEQLPGGKYKEWDVNARDDLPRCSAPGCGAEIRGPERLVTPKDGPGPAYYTPDHYGTFYYVGEFTG